MGSPKPLLPLGDDTYLGAILKTLARAPVVEPLVVLGHSAAEVVAAVDLESAGVVVNEHWARGMLSSLQLAVHKLRDGSQADAILLVLVDVPRFCTVTVERLVSAFSRSRAPLIVPTYAGGHGHPVLFARALFDELLCAPTDHGARAVVDAHRADLLEVDVDDPWVVRDADTPDDHRRLTGVG